MELTKTREELVVMAQRLATVEGLKGFKLCYGVERTNDFLAPEMKAIAKAQELLKDYREEQDALAQKFAAKDKDGKPVVLGAGFKVGDLAGYNRASKELERKHAKLIEQHKAFLAEEVKIRVHAVTEDEIPKDITSDQMRAVFPLISQKE